MSAVRAAGVGATRVCPHCRETILESAAVCPACRHHLRFDPASKTQRAAPSFSPLRVEGTIRHPGTESAWEYSVLLSIKNDRGEEIARRVVGVGAMHADEQRSFTLAVEVYKPDDVAPHRS